MVERVWRFWGDHGLDILATDDGGALMTGLTLSTDGDASGNHGGNGDVLVGKIDAEGKLQWSRALGGSGVEYSSHNSLVQTSGGNYLIGASSSSSNGDRKSLNGRSDGWVVELNSQGQLVSQQSFGGRAEDAVYSIRHIQDDIYLAVGSTASSDGRFTNNHGDWDAWAFTFKVP